MALFVKQSLSDNLKPLNKRQVASGKWCIDVIHEI
jgi:hypothetical protein